MAGARSGCQRRLPNLVSRDRAAESGGGAGLTRAACRDVFTHDILPYISCVILGPGPGSPHKAADFSWPKRLILEFGDVLPIWGVCLGHQGLATAFGGDVSGSAVWPREGELIHASQVVKAPAPIHGQVSQIRHAQDELFAGVPEVFGAVQFNSLVVKTSTLPAELEAIGWAMNKGEENIMALRHRTRPLWGVQFHPEVRFRASVRPYGC